MKPELKHRVITTLLILLITDTRREAAKHQKKMLYSFIYDHNNHRLLKSIFFWTFLMDACAGNTRRPPLSDVFLFEYSEAQRWRKKEEIKLELEQKEDFVQASFLQNPCIGSLHDGTQAVIFISRLKLDIFGVL